MLKRHERRWYYDRGQLVEQPLWSICKRCRRQHRINVTPEARDPNSFLGQPMPLLEPDEVQRCYECSDSRLYTADELDEAGRPVSLR